MLASFLLLLVLASLFILLRVLPVWPHRFQGCDAYNILLNAECLRQSWKLPIRIPPNFMLEDQDQWYPPGFLILCAFLPNKLLERYYWLLNHIVDFGSGILIYFGAQLMGADLGLSFFAVLAYATMAGLINEFSSLNVRPFGLLLFNGLMLSIWASTTNPAFIPVVGLLGIAIFYSHKLSTQQLWFTLPVLSGLTHSFYWIGSLAGLYVLSFLLWPRGAWRVLRGHWVIVKFWHRNWRSLGAHAVKQSPIYGDGHTQQHYYANEGIASYVEFLKNALHQNYFIIPFAIAVLTSQITINSVEGKFLIAWVGSVYVWAFAIHVLKPLRGIGLGQQYFKFALMPTLIGTVLALTRQEDFWLLIALAAAIVLTLRQYLLIVRSAYQQSSGATADAGDTDLDNLLSIISRDAGAHTLCLPVHLCDLVAYRTRRPVYWGTHSDVFDKRLEAFFPVLQHELSYYANDGATRLLLDTRYASAQELHLDSKYLIGQSGSYSLYTIEEISQLEKL